mmetsp:Transcript_46737/g.111278  ORF Transcript_46737/g.111278 Transcript_46737/m.111278 type:complete len:211 (-) Transcript_46737:315-947(-)
MAPPSARLLGALCCGAPLARVPAIGTLSRAALFAVLAICLGPALAAGGVAPHSAGAACRPVVSRARDANVRVEGPSRHLALRMRGGGKDDEEEEDPARAQKDNELISQLQGMRNQCTQLTERISMIETEIEDHASAANVLRDYAAARPCKRMVGGVLIDSTVGEVLPAVENEGAMLTKAVEDLIGKLRERRDTLEEFKRTHNIRVSAGRQ